MPGSKTRCFYTVVRYVADPVRNEPRNLGVIVVCPDLGYAKGRFSLSRTGLPATSAKYDFLRSLIAEWDLRGAAQMDFLAPLMERVDLERLHVLQDQSTNTIQFTPPLPAPG